MKRSIEKLRLEYGNTPLLQEELIDDPLEQFGKWLEEAIEARVIEPNGCILSTVSPLGRPSGRTVLLKQYDEKGLVFFTNYKSRKGVQIENTPFGALTFWWKEIYRQVLFEGRIEKTSKKISKEYFEKRPRGAQIAALTSAQSASLASRLELEEHFSTLQKSYRGKEVPLPPHWGGYRLIPERIELWQGRKNRLHDRFLYVLVDGEWSLSRLSP